LTVLFWSPNGFGITRGEQSAVRCMLLFDGAPRNMLRLPRGDEMRRQMERSSPIGGNVGTESLLGFLQYAVNLVLAQDGAHHRQPAPQISFDHRPNAGELRRPVMGGDFG
jgi:hypothetical protein